MFREELKPNCEIWTVVAINFTREQKSVENITLFMSLVRLNSGICEFPSISPNLSSLCVAAKGYANISWQRYVCCGSGFQRHFKKHGLHYLFILDIHGSNPLTSCWAPIILAGLSIFRQLWQKPICWTFPTPPPPLSMLLALRNFIMHLRVCMDGILARNFIFLHSYI
jgi:hypothetical protein